MADNHDTSSHDDGEKGNGAETAPSRLLTILEWPVIISGVVSTMLVLVTFLLAIYAIFQRYFFDTPLKWGDEMKGYLLVAIVMLGAAEALRNGDHISIDLVSAKLPGQAGKWITVFSSFAVLVFACVFGISAWETVTFSHGFGSYSSGYLETPMWIPQSAMLVGAVLLGLAALTRLLAAVYGKRL